MKLFNEILGELLGSYSAAFYISYFIFTFLGVLISLRIHAFQRDKDSKKTPFKFSWKFLVQDNLIRLITSMATVFVVIRLGSELLYIAPSYGMAVVMGISFDQILIQLQKIELKARE